MTTVVSSEQPVSEDASTLRFEIDELDRDIVKLLARRAKVSAAIQRARVRSGGARVDLSRENEILTNYAQGLGPAGKDLGHAILTYCRGDANAARNESQG